MFTFTLSPQSGVPVYLQLVQQVKNAIRIGRLQPGDQLPTAKDVVATLALNPNTVLKAYRELEREDLVVARPGAGTFVHRHLGMASPEACDRLLGELRVWIQHAHSAELDAEDIRALFAAASAFRKDRGQPQVLIHQTADER